MKDFKILIIVILAIVGGLWLATSRRKISKQESATEAYKAVRVHFHNYVVPGRYGQGPRKYFIELLDKDTQSKFLMLSIAEYEQAKSHLSDISITYDVVTLNNSDVKKCINTISTPFNTTFKREMLVFSETNHSFVNCMELYSKEEYEDSLTVGHVSLKNNIEISLIEN